MSKRSSAKPPRKVRPSNGKHPRAGQFGHRTRAADHRELAARGGRKAHQLGGAHEFTQEEAMAAGRKSSLMKHNEQEQAARAARIAERLATKGATDHADAED